MAGERAWKWDLDEMRSAAAMDSPLGGQYGPSIVSGFTPINVPRKPQVSGKRPSSSENTATAKSNKKVKVSEKCGPTASATKPISKAREPSGPRKSKRSKTAEELKCKDISQGLSRTKSNSSAAATESGKIASHTEVISVDADVVHSSETERGGDVSRNDGVVDVPSRLSGLAEKPQAPYGDPNHQGVDPKVMFVDSDRSGVSKNHEEGDAIDELFNSTTSPNTLKADPMILESPLNNGNDAFEDFSLLPSAQRNMETGEKNQPLLNQIWGSEDNFEKSFDGDDVFGDDDEQDEFPIDDEGLAEIMYSVDPPGRQDNADKDWSLSPEEFADDPMILEDVDLDGDQQSRPVSVSGHANLAAVNPKNHVSSHFQAPAPFRILSQTVGHVAKASLPRHSISEGSENCFDDDDLDEDLADLAVNGSEIMQPKTVLTTPEKPSEPKLQWLPAKTFTPAKSSQIPVSPVDIPHVVPVNKNGEALPFTRPPFPRPIRNRSPILGLSNRTVLRTCFRVGEAINAAAVASRSGIDAIIELYARVIVSEREVDRGFKQFFKFGDLFTDRPPHLNGVYTYWKGVPLWDFDSRAFIGENGKGKIARVMGRIKKVEKGDRYEFVVLSIWEVDWEDVGVAKGIVCS